MGEAKNSFICLIKLNKSAGADYGMNVLCKNMKILLKDVLAIKHRWT